MRRLTVNPDTPSAWEITLEAGIITLGREEGNDIVINHPSVAANHCELMITDATVTVTDPNAASGIFIAGRAVNEYALQPGQIFQVGEILMRLDEVAATAETSVVSSNDHCRFHPHNPARHRCPKCHQNFCEMCVNTRQSKSYCRACAMECIPLLPAIEQETTTEQSFTGQILSAFKFPLKGDGLILIAIGTFFFLLLKGVGFVAKYGLIYGWIAILILTVLGTGYLTSYLRRILSATALGEDEMPEWPDIADYHGDLVVPFWQLIVTVLFCFAPAIGLTIFAATLHNAGDTSWLGWASVASILLGCVYFPMAFTAVAMFDTVGAVNPLLIVPSILKVLREYVLTVVVLALILVLRWVFNNYLATILPVPLLPLVLSSMAGLYLMIVEARILGLLYRHKKYELGWFK